MKPVYITYYFKIEDGYWRQAQYTTNDCKEYNRILDIIHTNPDYCLASIEKIRKRRVEQ